MHRCHLSLSIMDISLRIRNREKYHYAQVTSHSTNSIALISKVIQKNMFAYPKKYGHAHCTYYHIWYEILEIVFIVESFGESFGIPTLTVLMSHFILLNFQLFPKYVSNFNKRGWICFNVSGQWCVECWWQRIVGNFLLRDFSTDSISFSVFPLYFEMFTHLFGLLTGNIRK